MKYVPKHMYYLRKNILYIGIIKGVYVAVEHLQPSSNVADVEISHYRYDRRSWKAYIKKLPIESN